MTEISKKYLQTIDDLEHITGLAMTMSLETYNREVNSWREQYCSYIFSKLTMHAQAVLLIRPQCERPLDQYEIDFWDISSIATLTRSIIDSYYVFFYLGIDQANENELEFRFNLWNYHSEKQRLDMLKKVKSTNPIMTELQEEVTHLKEKLLGDSFYQSLEPKIQRRVRKGEIGIFYSNSELSERAGIDADYYKAIYNDLSAHVHAYPYALTQLAVFRSNDEESLSSINTIMEVCIGYICHAVRDFLIIMPDQEKYLDQKAKTLIGDWEFIFRNEG